MGQIEDIREGLKALCAAPIQVVVAIVQEVDEDALSMICRPIGDGANYEDVRLKATIGQDKSGLYVIPKVNTSVLLGIINNDEDTTFLLTAEAIDKIVAKVGSSTAIIKDGAIEFNGGSLGGLIKIEQLMEYFNSNFQFLNAIKAAISDVGSYPTASEGAPDTFHIALKALLDPIATPDASRNQIEDTTIKH